MKYQPAVSNRWMKKGDHKGRYKGRYKGDHKDRPYKKGKLYFYRHLVSLKLAVVSLYRLAVNRFVRLHAEFFI